MSNRHSADMGVEAVMNQSDKESGIIFALIERYEKYRLPRILSIKDRLDEGEKLDHFDMEFMEEVISDAIQNKHLIDKHPEWQEFCANVVSLYEEIAEKALENEKHKSRH